MHDRKISDDEYYAETSNRFDDRPDCIGQPFYKNGVQVKVADSGDQVLPSYTSAARNCNLGLLAINTKGLHGHAIFHLNPSHYNGLKTKEDVEKFIRDFASKINLLFYHLDKLIQDSKLDTKDPISIDFFHGGGYSKKRSMSGCPSAQGSQNMRDLIQRIIRDRLKKTKELASSKALKISFAKSMAWGKNASSRKRSPMESSLHYDPKKNLISVTTTDLRGERKGFQKTGYKPEDSYSVFKIHKLHAA